MTEVLLLEIAQALSAGELVLLLARPADAQRARARDAARRLGTVLTRFFGVACVQQGRSASAGLAAVVLYQAEPVAVDVEAALQAGMLGRVPDFTHPSERSLLEGTASRGLVATRLWTRKEAALKAWGVGLAVAPASVATGAGTERWQALEHALMGPARICSLSLAEPGHGVAVALAGESEPRVRVFIQDAPTQPWRAHSPAFSLC